MALHFVGFRDGSELWRAMQIWGTPDFIHVKADTRLFQGGELDTSDTVIFAKGSKADSLDKARELNDTHTVDDSNDFKCHYRKLTGQVPW